MRIIGTLTVLAGLAISTFAQTPLSLQDAIKTGLENSRSLKISELSAVVAQKKYQEVNAGRWASLAVQGSYTRLSSVPPFLLTLPASLAPLTGGRTSFEISPSVLNAYNVGVTLRQPVFTGFQLENSATAAERNAQAAEFDVRADKSQLEVGIATAYWNLYAAVQEQQVMQENLQRVKAHYKQARDMMDQGLLTESDALSVKVQVANGRLSLLGAENDVRLATVALNNILGTPLSTDYAVTSSPQTGDTTLQDVASLLATAQARRPELASQRNRVEAAEAAVRAAWGAYLPQISLFGDYYYQRPNQRYQPILDQFKGTWDAGVTVSLPIWNWGQIEDKVDQARAQREQAHLADQQMADAVYLEVTQNYLNFKLAKDRIDAAGEAVQDAEASYTIINQKFGLGLATNTDLLDAETALLQAKLNHTRALTALEIARVSLASATGQL